MFDIITDSACDLTLDTAKQLQIEVVPFYVSLDGEHYRKEGKEIAVRDFYQFMVDNPSAYPKTSLASIEDFEQAFRAHAAAGRDVLCLVFTSKMSGCVGSARNARDLVLEDFPDARIEVIDSAAATVTESTMVENAVAMRDAGCSLDETVTWLQQPQPLGLWKEILQRISDAGRIAASAGGAGSHQCIHVRVQGSGRSACRCDGAGIGSGSR